jgi:hypothetical protein
MSDIKLLEKIKDYDKPWCYQYDRRIIEHIMELYGKH